MSTENGFPGFTPPAAGTEAPLEMLAACHGRVERQCATLRRLATHIQTHGSDMQARTAAVNVMRYFDTAAKHHHEDEEADLFPALLEAMAGSDAVCLRELVAGLAGEHRDFERMWTGLRSDLAEIVVGGAALLPPAAVESFVAAYASHIEKEDSELLPLAARILSEGQLDAIGRAMRLRRGIP